MSTLRVARAVAALVMATALAAHPAYAAETDSTAAVRGDTLAHVVQLPPIEVSTTRAAGIPIAVTTLGRDTLNARNIGLDTPMLLAETPNAYAYSDAGNGVGYSYLSIRGFPQRRISVLIDGVPLNDPQSHEVYWIDHPDLLASTSEVRGAARRRLGALRRRLARRQREPRDVAVHRHARDARRRRLRLVRDQAADAGDELGPTRRRLEPVRPLLAHRELRLPRSVVVEAVVVRVVGTT
jgi:hypothetical protein